MRTLLLSALLFTVGQSTADWTKVAMISGGSEIRVELDAGSVAGQFLDSTPDTLHLSVGGRETSIDRARVRSVQQRRSGPSRRLRNAGIGFVVGIGAGLIGYKATCKTNCLAEGAVVWTVPLELVGAVTGAAWPTTRWETVYRK